MPLPERSSSSQDSPTVSKSAADSMGSPCDATKISDKTTEEQCAKDEVYLERMRRHQSYAAQYRQEVERGNFSSELGYFPAPSPEQTNQAQQQFQQEKSVAMKQQSSKPSNKPPLLSVAAPFSALAHQLPAAQQDQDGGQRQIYSSLNEVIPLSNGQNHQNSAREQQLMLGSTWSLVLPSAATGSSSGASGKTFASVDDGRVTEFDLPVCSFRSNCSSISNSPDHCGVELSIPQGVGFANQNTGFSLAGYNGLPTPIATTRTTPNQAYSNEPPATILDQYSHYSTGPKPYQAPIARPEKTSGGIMTREKSGSTTEVGLLGENQAGPRSVARATSLYDISSQSSFKNFTLVGNSARVNNTTGDYAVENSFPFNNDQAALPYAGLHHHSVAPTAHSDTPNPFSQTPEPDAHFSVNNYFLPQLKVHQYLPVSESAHGDTQRNITGQVDYHTTVKPAFREHDRTQKWANELEVSMNNLYLNTSPPAMLTPSGIDHYHGSPHHHSQYGPVIAQAMKNAAVLNGSHPYFERARPVSAGLRCGQACQLTKTSLDDANKRITRLLREVDRLKNQVLELNYQLQISESHRKALHAEMHQLQMAMTQSATARHDITNRLDEYYRSFMAQFQSMPDSVSTNHRVPSDEELKWMSDDTYVQQELVMFFHDVKCWTERFLKFPTGVPISADLDTLLHKMCDNKSELDFLLGNENTKAFVIMGLTVRWLKENVIIDTFARQRNGFTQTEKQIEQRCENLADYFHAMIVPWISRCHDQSVVRQCRESLQTCVRHAARLADLMVKAGGPTAWHIDFPAYGEPFRSDWMENVEDVRHRRGGQQQRMDLEQYRVKLSGTPLIVRCKIESGQPDFSKIVRAQVLLLG